MKFLTNPSWLRVFIALLALAVGIAVYLQRPIKKLRVEILSNSPLVSINTAMAKEMEILYKGKSVQTLSVILLKFENTGNTPILESDYSEPIRVTMSESASIGEVTIQETRPGEIPLLPTVSAANQVALGKVLLNPGDQAVLRILALNNADATLRISARIVGVGELDIESVFQQSKGPAGTIWELVAVFIVVLVLVVLAAAIWESRRVMEWRKKRFGFDPARYYYTLAQTRFLTMPASDDTQEAFSKASMSLSQVIRYLDQCFSWDTTYIETVNNDPLFSKLHSYEKYKEITAKHHARIGIT